MQRRALLASSARIGVVAAAALAAAILGWLVGGSGSSAPGAAEPASTVGVRSDQSSAAQRLGIPSLVTRNTTRINGADPVADAAGVALAVYPSATASSHPAVVTLAPTGDWQAAIAASVLMAPPLHAPVLLSGATRLPAATAQALLLLGPTGAGAAGGAQVIRVGDVPAPAGLRSSTIAGNDPYTLAAAIDRYESAVTGRPSAAVVIASADAPAYAMPAAGWAAESGDPVLFVSSSGIPQPTRQALQAHGRPQIYVLGPASVISDALVRQLGAYGTVKRVGANGPAANSVAFAAYRDPPCAYGQPCAHVPGSFGWAIRSPGHGYVLLNASRPLDAAAAAALSGSADFGPQLLVDDPTTLPRAVLDYFLNYATPGYTQEGPTAAVYNHGWVIGDQAAISVAVQARMDDLLQAIPQSTTR
ncbi:MAG: cell wall-binding repeat-containing protein [Solirubrobacteraceae bacterium]